MKKLVIQRIRKISVLYIILLYLFFSTVITYNVFADDYVIQFVVRDPIAYDKAKNKQTKYNSYRFLIDIAIIPENEMVRGNQNDDSLIFSCSNKHLPFWIRYIDCRFSYSDFIGVIELESPPKGVYSLAIKAYMIDINKKMTDSNGMLKIEPVENLNQAVISRGNFISRRKEEIEVAFPIEYSVVAINKNTGYTLPFVPDKRNYVKLANINQFTIVGALRTK